MLFGRGNPRRTCTKLRTELKHRQGQQLGFLFYFFDCESSVSFQLEINHGQQAGSFPTSGLLAILVSPDPLRLFRFVGSLIREQKANPARDRLDACSLSLAMGDQLLDNISFRCDWIDVRHELASLRHPG